ncbi:hypothetical protein SCG7086_AM_00090 [Chlamydiales bacterium SCGC AG-110-P3]|nr:hypothetical protein SCG7086_AM_00090 [Chlamydiales bacterium SCGC AG-110-P3]
MDASNKNIDKQNIRPSEFIEEVKPLAASVPQETDRVTQVSIEVFNHLDNQTVGSTKGKGILAKAAAKYLSYTIPKKISDLAAKMDNGKELDTFLETLLATDGDLLLKALTTMNNLDLSNDTEDNVKETIGKAAKKFIGRYEAPMRITELLRSGTADQLISYVNQLSESDTKEDSQGLNLALRSLHTSPSTKSNSILTEASQKLAIQNQIKMQGLGESTHERTHKRTPSEVTINALALLRSAANEYPDQSDQLSKCAKECEDHILIHNLSLKATKEFLNEIKSNINDLELTDLSTKLDALLTQLPEQQSSRARLHDNVYGRVYDSAMINHLVQTPPEGVKSAMNITGKAFAAWLTNLGSTESQTFRNKTLNSTVKHVHADPRSWSPKVPGLKAIEEAETYDDALNAILDLLNTEPQTGFDCIALSYLTIKLSLAVQDTVCNDLVDADGYVDTESYYKQLQAKAPWMDNCNDPYTEKIGPQTSRTNKIADATLGYEIRTNATKLKDKSAGITLRHQPAAIVGDDEMQPAVRPAVKNLLDIRGPETKKRLKNSHSKHSPKGISNSAHTALEAGLPWASGVSGSTNIALYAYRDLVKGHARNEQSDLNIHDFLLGTMMFLVYDGGHSMHEVLWTASLFDKENLKEGLNLGNTKNDQSFVSDYKSYMELQGTDTQADLTQAAKEAFDDVVNYFNKNSYYREKENTPLPDFPDSLKNNQTGDVRASTSAPPSLEKFKPTQKLFTDSIDSPSSTDWGNDLGVTLRDLDTAGGEVSIDLIGLNDALAILDEIFNSIQFTLDNGEELSIDDYSKELESIGARDESLAEHIESKLALFKNSFQKREENNSNINSPPSE